MKALGSLKPKHLGENPAYVNKIVMCCSGDANVTSETVE